MADELVVVDPEPEIISVVTVTDAGYIEVNHAIPGPRGPQGVPGDANDGGALSTHIGDTTPHPAYDDLPSLTLLFENGLV